MPNFWSVVDDVIRKSDLLILVLDARLVDHTRNEEVERKVARAKKPLLFVINKSDLVEKHLVEQYKKEFDYCVFMSAKERLGTAKLRETILGMRKGQETVVGVLGYPNVGKSSIINAIRGGGSPAKVADRPGMTRGVQIIKVSGKLRMLDSPGVIPFMERDEIKHALIGSKDPHKLKQPDMAAAALLESYREHVSGWYDIEVLEEDDGFDLIEKIAMVCNYKAKGNTPDVLKASRRILIDWQKGKIRL